MILFQVKAMLELFISKMVQKNKRKGALKEAAEYFTRPAAELDKEILERLNLLPGESYTKVGIFILNTIKAKFCTYVNVCVYNKCKFVTPSCR